MTVNDPRQILIESAFSGDIALDEEVSTAVFSVIEDLDNNKN